MKQKLFVSIILSLFLTMPILKASELETGSDFLKIRQR